MVASNDSMLEYSDGGELVMSSVAEGGIVQIVHQPNGWVRKQLSELLGNKLPSFLLQPPLHQHSEEHWCLT